MTLPVYKLSFLLSTSEAQNLLLTVWLCLILDSLLNIFAKITVEILPQIIIKNNVGRIETWRLLILKLSQNLLMQN